MDEGEQGEDIGPEPLLDVSLEQAKHIIQVALPRRRRAETPEPDPQKLAEGIKLLRLEYNDRNMMDSMATLNELEAAYKILLRASQSFRGAIDKIQSSFWHDYFMAVLGQGSALRDDGESDYSELYGATALAGRMTEYAEEALREVDAARGPEGAERWYEHEERQAQHWLYGHGLPQLYEEIFGSAYSISGDLDETRPSLRFAQVVLDVGRLPTTSPATLRKHARRP